MKKAISMLLAFIILAITSNAKAETVVVEENFDSNEMGWTENSKPENGECIITEGQFKFDSKKSYFYTTNSVTPSLLISEGVMPIDPAQGFTVSVDIEFKHAGTFLGTFDFLNLTSGILLEYDDDYNFTAIAVNEKSCYILIFKEGKLIRYKASTVKMKVGEKNMVSANLKVEYQDYKLKIYVDDIEMTGLRKVNIESPVIALFTAGKQKVSFDNVIVSQ